MTFSKSHNSKPIVPFIMLSPDGFTIERETKVYHNLEDAYNDFENILLKRLETQGYYSTSNRDRIPLSDLWDHMTFVPA